MKKQLTSLKSRSLQKNTLLAITGGKMAPVDTLNLTNRGGKVSQDSVTEDQ